MSLHLLSLFKEQQGDQLGSQEGGCVSGKTLEHGFADHADRINSQLLSQNDPHGDGGTLEYQDGEPAFQLAWDPC